VCVTDIFSSDTKHNNGVVDSTKINQSIVLYFFTSKYGKAHVSIILIRLLWELKFIYKLLASTSQVFTNQITMAKVKLNLGSKIKMLREMRGISQEAVAFDIGLSQQAFQQIEAGKTKIDLDRADSIARSLSIDLESLLAFQPVIAFTKSNQISDYNNTNFQNENLLNSLNSQITMMRENMEYLRNQNIRLFELLRSNNKDSLG